MLSLCPASGHCARKSIVIQSPRRRATERLPRPQSEHFCNFLIDYEREPRRLLDSSIGRLGAAQDLVDENGYMMRHFDLISSIGKQVAETAISRDQPQEGIRYASATLWI